MLRVARAVDSWAAEFESAHVYGSAHGPIVPKVNIGAIQGGAPFRPNYYPGVCSVYIDVRTPPDLRPLQVQRELQAALAKLDVEYELEMYASKMGYEAKGVEPIVQVIEESYQSLFSKKTPAPTGLHASIWTDTNVYNEMGIRACKFGLGGGRWKFRSEQIDIGDILRGAQVYALAALEICNWQKLPG
jgi:acetylornithine deacetylase/succinyl-diaminopimelate desuccinylase-like protein